MVEQVFAAAPAFLPGNRVVAAPSQFVFTGAESLRLTVFRGASGVALSMQGRFRDDADGTVKPFNQSIPDAPLAVAGDTYDFTFPPGALYNVRVGTSTLGVSYGLMFVRVQQVVGTGANAIVLGTMLQGYISTKSDLAWPGSPVQHVHEGRGFLLNTGWTVQTGATLSATILCPAHNRYEVVAGRVDVICSAVAGARGVYLELLDAGGNLFFTSGVTTTLAPGEVRAICCGAAIPARATSIGGVEWLDLPDGIELDDSLQLRVLVAGNQAGDALTARGALVRRWFND